MIRNEIDMMDSRAGMYSDVGMEAIPSSNSTFSIFETLSEDDVRGIIMSISNASFPL